MLTHVLDTSAWLAHIQREMGWERVRSLLLNQEYQVGISALSLVELYARLRSYRREEDFPEILEDYRRFFVEIVPVYEAVALRAITIRQTAGHRIPTVDAIIAATAAEQGAILVHRDPHFLAITEERMKQHFLGEEKG